MICELVDMTIIDRHRDNRWNYVNILS